MADTSDLQYIDKQGGTALLKLRDLTGGLYASTVEFPADLRAGLLVSGEFTLGAAGTVTSIPVPAGARGVVLYADKAVRVAVNEDPEAAVADQLKKGALVRASEQVVRLFGSDAVTLRLLAGVGGEKVYVEFF